MPNFTPMLTDEQISKSLNRKESFFFTDKEIEKLWHEASLKKNIDLQLIKNAYFESFLDAMFIKAFKIDKAKAFIICDIKDYLKEVMHILKINNLQAELINNSNLKLFEKEVQIRELTEEVALLKSNILK